MLKIIFLLFLISTSILPQTDNNRLQQFQNSIDSLEQIKAEVLKQINAIEVRIKDLKFQRNQIETADKLKDGFFLKVKFAGYSRSEPDILGDKLMEVPSGDSVLILDILNGYYKISYNNEVSYLNEMYLDIADDYDTNYLNGSKEKPLGYTLTNSAHNKESIISSDRCITITNAGTQCKRNAQPGSSYCWQHQPSYKASGSSRTIYTGPRGGKYYINSNGNKTYIKK